MSLGNLAGYDVICRSIPIPIALHLFQFTVLLFLKKLILLFLLENYSYHFRSVFAECDKPRGISSMKERLGKGRRQTTLALSPLQVARPHVGRPELGERAESPTDVRLQEPWAGLLMSKRESHLLRRGLFLISITQKLLNLP